MDGPGTFAFTRMTLHARRMVLFSRLSTSPPRLEPSKAFGRKVQDDLVSSAGVGS